MALTLEWRGRELHPEGFGVFAGGNNRLDTDGHVQWIEDGRLALTTAAQFGRGPCDYLVLDTVTGYRMACRGTPRPVLLRNDETRPRVLIGDYEIMFGRDTQRVGPRDKRSGEPFRPADWFSANGYLESGEIVLTARHPRSLQRCVRRARGAGAVDFGKGLLIFESPTPGEWPPAPRVRGREKRGTRAAEPAARRPWIERQTELPSWMR